MGIRTAVAEKELHKVSAGTKGTATPTGFPDMKLTAILDRVAAVPTSSEKFDARLSVALDSEAAALMPGMTCKVKLVAYQKDEALTVPPKAVATDAPAGRKHFVCLVTEKDKRKKQYVTVGKRTDKQVEILKGLSEGDKVLSVCPKDLK
jgi:multidrug efflux pump subunit AcrA (membrane-fusion protein)